LCGVPKSRPLNQSQQEDPHMTESTETIKKLVAECSPDEQKAVRQYLSVVAPHPLEREWGIDADTILSAIRRSSDLTRRGVRGIIAEAVFENAILPPLAGSGWEAATIMGDLSYDVHMKKGDQSARIQIKLQRLEKGVPKLYYPKHYEQGSLYVVEVQKTRSGEKTTKRVLEGTDTVLEAADTVTEQTRPYRFGDFDILAVNMHPSSGDWKSFRYTIASWLLPRSSDKALIEVFQPVAAEVNEVWTDDLATCLSWLEAGEQRSVLTDLLHLSKAKRAAKNNNLFS
jgi:hypothetical protein